MDYPKLYPLFGIAAHGAFYNWWIFKQYGQNRVVAKYYYPENPRTAYQQSNRVLFYDAVRNWQGFSDSVKDTYNQVVLNKPLSGYNRYISLYLEANKNVIIYWKTLEKDAADNMTISSYMTSNYIPIVRKTAVQTLTQKTLSTGCKLDANADPNLSLVSMARQAIINGNFDVWQRGTTVDKSASRNIYSFLADRWWSQAYSGGGGGNNAYTESRQVHTLGQTDVPGEPKYFHRFDLTTAGLEQAGTIMRTRYKIEGVGTFAGQTVTLSFYAKAESSRNMGVCVKQNFGIGGAPSVSVDTSGGIHTLTTSWQKFTVTIAIPSISGKTLGTTAGTDNLEIGLFYYKANDETYATPTGQIGTWSTGTFDIDQIQICAGSVALPFQPKSFDEEYLKCQRYYQKSFDYTVTPAQATTAKKNHIGATFSADGMRVPVVFPVKMHTAPTVTLYGDNAVAGDNWSYFDGTWTQPTTDTPVATECKFYVEFTHVANFTVWQCLMASGFWTADAEL